MQAIAAENNLAETAFFVRAGRGLPAALVHADRRGRPLRSCDARLGLCRDAYPGTRPAFGQVRHAQSRAARGDARRRSAWRWTSRPGRRSEKPADPRILAALGKAPAQSFVAHGRTLAVYDRAEDVAALRPDFAAMRQVPGADAIVTAPGRRRHRFRLALLRAELRRRRGPGDGIRPLRADTLLGGVGSASSNCGRGRSRRAAAISCAPSAATASRSPAVPCSISKARSRYSAGGDGDGRACQCIWGSRSAFRCRTGRSGRVRRARAMEGRFCTVEPIDPARHAAELHAAYLLDKEGRNWTYLPYGPFDRLEDYRDWLERGHARRRPAPPGRHRAPQRARRRRRQLHAHRPRGSGSSRSAASTMPRPCSARRRRPRRCI